MACRVSAPRRYTASRFYRIRGQKIHPRSHSHLHTASQICCNTAPRLPRAYQSNLHILSPPNGRIEAEILPYTRRYTIIYKFFYISMVVFPHKYVIIHDEIWQSASVFSLFSINIVSCNPTDIPCIFEIFRRQHIPLAP